MAEFNEDFDGIKITETNQREDGWTFIVELGHGESLIEYFVDVDREYWTKLTGRRIEPSQLVETAFKFLLEREQKEAILKKFNIADIGKYFPHFEDEIRRLL